MPNRVKIGAWLRNDCPAEVLAYFRQQGAKGGKIGGRRPPSG